MTRYCTVSCKVPPEYPQVLPIEQPSKLLCLFFLLLAIIFTDMPRNQITEQIPLQCDGKYDYQHKVSAANPFLAVK